VTTILDQQFITHLFALAHGPDTGFRALDEIWRGCALQLRMTDPVPGTGLPSLLYGIQEALPADGEIPLAAQERPGADCQAVLRLHHDLLNLSVALAPPEARQPELTSSGEATWPWWRIFDRQWSMITGPNTPHLAGEARLYLARVEAGAGLADAGPALYEDLRSILPADAASPRAQSAAVIVPGVLTLWETSTGPDERALRRFVLAIAPDADPAASDWVWSAGDLVVPPLARYLLHAAKVRFELRVWRRDSQTRQVRESLDNLTAELVRLGAPEPAKAELLRLSQRSATFLHADLRDLRHTVEIAADNMSRAFDLSGMLGPGSPFADDAALALHLAQQLDDEVGYLGRSAERAETITGAVSAPATPAATHMSEDLTTQFQHQDYSRNVFVVYGRDEQARAAIFAFLGALRLWPLEWEAVVAESGKTTPSLGEAVRRGLAAARAVVVLMTPEDVVHLHPDLLEPHEAAAGIKDGMQARPNVLLELGMALITHPERTLILMAGEHRQITDLGGLNFIRIDDTPDCRRKIASRLRLAGCAVDDSGQDWLHAGDFSGLAALRRAP
jgi:predicted nucleotide-binding protein